MCGLRTIYQEVKSYFEFTLILLLLTTATQLVTVDSRQHLTVRCYNKKKKNAVTNHTFPNNFLSFFNLMLKMLF